MQSASRVRMMGAHSGRGVRSKEGLDASAISPPHKRDQIMFGQPHPLEFPRPGRTLTKIKRKLKLTKA